MTTPPGYARWTPSLPTSLMGIFSPFQSSSDSTASQKDATPNANDGPGQTSRVPPTKRPMLSTITVKDAPSGPPSPSKSTGSTMFAEPETRSTSDDGSRDGSIDELRRSKKTSRPKTQFSICHPPPESKVKQRLHRRPRSLLQLHRLSPSARPLPAFEVIPSANFSVRLTRAITRVFKAKHGLCPNDLVIVKAEKYTKEEEEEQEARDVIGLICKGRRDEEKNPAGKATIHMASGKVWEASCLANGAYEFCTTDEHGLGRTVRWVPRKDKSGKMNPQRKFNFSTISPNSRRHPVIAYLKKTGLDINDKYKVPEPSTNTPMGSPSKSTTALEDAMDEEYMNQEHCETDDQLREIITMTAIWVTFKEGWSPSFRYEESAKDSSLSTPPGSPAPAPVEKRSSMRSIGSGIIRRTSVLSKSNRSSTASIAEEEEPPAPSRSTSVSTRNGRARADSSSTVLIHRATSNRRKNNNPQATWRPDLLASHDPLPETSREDLSRDFSAAQEPSTPTKKPSPLSDSRGDATQRRSATMPPSGLDAPTQTFRTSLEKPDHRESSATTETSGCSSPAGRAPQKRAEHKRKKSAWRRLLCGQSDV